MEQHGKEWLKLNAVSIYAVYFSTSINSTYREKDWKTNTQILSKIIPLVGMWWLGLTVDYTVCNHLDRVSVKKDCLD